ncbi:high mobility group box domain-containing protein, partial [Mycena olivaceomarginata]
MHSPARRSIPTVPMNAFMIFARRRRPQISVENQSMRTGDISKILCTEWKAMLPTEKQFYLAQAKRLKDTFNKKYLEYVYRRRPNNTRKKRPLPRLPRPSPPTRRHPTTQRTTAPPMQTRTPPSLTPPPRP